MCNGDKPSCHEATWGSWVLFAPVPNSNCGEHIMSLLAFPFEGPYHPKPGSSRYPLPSCREVPSLVMMVVHLVGRQSPQLLLEHNTVPVLSGDCSNSVRGSKVSHTLTQKSCSLPTRGLELLTFLTKSLFLVLSALQSHGTLVGWAGFFCVLHIINKIVS